MTDKPKIKLALKVFCMSAVITAVCCIVTYAAILNYAPYIYQTDYETIEEIADMLADELEFVYYEEAPDFLMQYQDLIEERFDDEFELHIFNGEGYELDIYDLGYFNGGHIENYNDNDFFIYYNIEFEGNKSKFSLLITENVEKQSQIAVALVQAAPIVMGVIAAGSLAAAFFITLIIVKPINKLYQISRKMEHLDFNVKYTDKRGDEIGVLGRNLVISADKLSSALEDLKTANLRLEADIEKEREIERMQNDFFAAASNELKTPITIIKGNLEGMYYNIGRFKDRETYIKRSLATTERLQSLLNEILTITKMQTAESFSSVTEVNLSELIRSILSELKDLFEQKELTLLTDIMQNAVIFSDRVLLKKAIGNILTNAAVHTPEGEQVFVDLYTENGGYVLRVENTGTHICESEISRLFEPFYRPDTSRSDKTGGSGLGLYIVKRTADMLNAEAAISNTKSGVAVILAFKNNYTQTSR